MSVPRHATRNNRGGIVRESENFKVSQGDAEWLKRRPEAGRIRRNRNFSS
jgi:hypothetical protein